MKSDWKISFFKPDTPGTFPIPNGIQFAAELCQGEECGVILYGPDGKEWKIPFSSEGKSGALYGVQIEGDGLLKCQYNFYQGNRILTDPYAKAVSGFEDWGNSKGKPRISRGILDSESFDWEGDVPLGIPYEDTILYGLNVRAFTMHKSSGIRHKGTFEGVAEKIPYLKELGITAVELMPCYEYDECMADLSEDVVRLNCWGFQQGYYFAPKASYSASKRPAYSFKSMVKELHLNGIEVMMHFYFPPETKQLTMLNVIRYWVKEYHIDGVRLSGFYLPVRMLAEDAFLKNTKIRCGYLSEEELAAAGDAAFKNFAVNNGNFRNDMRRFLKGDEGLINEVLRLQRNNPEEIAVINYLADYNGFSLYDCVSYERKHNEANGEDNRDGEEINYTWNCGIEGDTRKKSVQVLRLNQLKNAIAFLFLSQGTPFLFSGDEFANTRLGNNNAYALDNDTGWIKWKDNQFSKELLSFTRFMIALRKNHAILHMKHPLKIMDTVGCGYPDISYHGTEAWRPDLSYISRMAGIMLCGQYATQKDDTFYLAYNMHWESHNFALPKLPTGYAWMKLIGTDRPLPDAESIAQAGQEADDLIEIKGRTVVVYKSVPHTPQQQSKTKKKK